MSHLITHPVDVRTWVNPAPSCVTVFVGSHDVIGCWPDVFNTVCVRPASVLLLCIIIIIISSSSSSSIICSGYWRRVHWTVSTRSFVPPRIDDDDNDCLFSRNTFEARRAHVLINTEDVTWTLNVHNQKIYYRQKRWNLPCDFEMKRYLICVLSVAKQTHFFKGRRFDNQLSLSLSSSARLL